jgi:hypothetical protein
MMRRHEFITLLGGVSASHISKYAAVSALLLRRFELLDERSKAARDRRRSSVVLRLETLPDGPQPSASIGNRNRALARGRGHPRRYPGEGGNPSCRLRFLGSKFGRSIAKRSQVCAMLSRIAPSSALWIFWAASKHSCACCRYFSGLFITGGLARRYRIRNIVPGIWVP